MYPTSRACAAQDQSPYQLAPLAHLLSPSNLRLVPVDAEVAGPVGHLSAPAIDEALAEVGTSSHT
ncbi:hypothetical protein pqer_cds_718 [Pandoravirus quercus]|uniref:Uncharacterized protein n=1 Tax=Pandoravirus quercus TaxID=2107709 RepID=A0A2U7U9T7_9VIRU|nr:hypothetical protein pqer_cds_718 [Pandoravirus quercus]AVK75140.1 hypothetical protein pqer_cds_718 [Pandoravirus quercus]